MKSGYFKNAWENLNHYRLHLALIGNFDIGNMTLQDAKFCIREHNELKKANNN